MRNRILILVLAVILLSGCEQYATYTPSAADLTTIAQTLPEGPTKDAVVGTAVARYQAAQDAQGTLTAAQAQAQQAQAELQQIALEQTAEAYSTIQAQQMIAQSTSQALDARATSQALDAIVTRQAADVLATATASAYQATATVEARQAQATATAEARLAQATATAVQATRESVQATATAESVNATATMQSAIDHAELTRVSAVGVAAQATAQAIERETEIAENRKVLTTWGGYGALFIFLAGLGAIVYMLLPSIAARLGAIPRDERGDPPTLVLAARGALGPITVLELPRLWSGATVIDNAVRQPQLTHTALQDAQSKRADFINMVKGGRPRPIVATPSRMGAPAPTQAEPWRVEDQDNGHAVNWPQRVNLLDVFADKTPSLNHLVIGAYPQADGRLAVVGESLHKLMHVLCCGSSGWGKSTFLSSFVWQLAQCREPVSVVAIDISGSEFNLLRGWNKLQFPVARSDKDAIATLQAVADELARRRELFERFPTARNLARYNRMSDDDLESWVILLDEGASLLARRDTGDTLRDAIQTSRQYGIYCLLSSVSVSHRVLETQTRDQFSTRLAFRLPKSSMRIVLDETPPEEPARPGRAWARLAGREMVQIQAPIVGEQELIAALQPGGPVEQLPDVDQAEARDPREQRVLDLLESEPELSDTAIARAAYGYANSRVVEIVQGQRKRMTKMTTVTNDSDNGKNSV